MTAVHVSVGVQKSVVSSFLKEQSQASFSRVELFAVTSGDYASMPYRKVGCVDVNIFRARL